MKTAAPGDADDGQRERRLAELFRAYLEAIDRGEDREQELLAQAGEHAAELAARMRLERELRALAPRAAPGPGEALPPTIGRFRILGWLGRGGLSVVYLAHDPDVGRRVALKVLQRESLLDKGGRAWLLNEARALAQIEHPNVLRIHEVGETGTHAYLAMELVTGPSLRAVLDELLRRSAGLPPSSEPGLAAMAERLRPYSARIAVLRQLADALATCHDLGVLHRDIKPHNILFDAQGTPKLIDFGLAHDARADEDSRIGLTQNLVGTAAYIAPEQVKGNETGADPRSDQFSFGVVAYECFALKNPFQRETQRATMAAVEEAEPPPLRALAAAVPPDLALVIQRALARDPAQRHASMAVLGRDLEAVLQHRPVSVQEPSLAHVARLWLRRHRRRVRVAGTALALFLGTLAVATLTDTLRQRARLREALATIEPDGFGSVQPFHDSAPLLAELKREAARLDARVWSRFLPASRAQVTASIDAWSRNLDRLWQTDVRASLGRATPLQDETYRQLFWQEGLLCPECPYNQENRLRGQVLLPEPPGYERALDILCQETLEARGGGVGDFTSFFRPAPLVESLTAGTYRLQLWEPGSQQLEAELVFYVAPGWNPVLRVPLQRPRASFLERSVPVEESEWRFSNGQSMHLPAFLVLDHLVTAGEFAEFVAATGWKLELGSDAGMPDDPAHVFYDSAMAFAQWAGGRLLTREEILTARRQGFLPSEAESASAGAEFSLSLGSDGNPLMILFGTGGNGMVQRRTDMLEATRRWVGFRLCFPLGSPQDYRTREHGAPELDGE